MSPHKPKQGPNERPGFRKFLYVSPKEARKEKVPLTALRSASDIYLRHLCMTPEQGIELKNLYKAGSISASLYDPRHPEDQIAAAALLAELGLDLNAQESLGNRWSVRWSGDTGEDKRKTCRRLYQWCVQH